MTGKTYGNRSGELVVTRAFACTLMLSYLLPVAAQTDRFSKAHKTVVPASKFARHYDDESVSDTGVSALSAPAAGSLSSNSNSSSAKASLSATKSDHAYSSSSHSISPGDTPALAKAKLRVEPLLEGGKFDTAQAVMKTYLQAYPNDAGMKAEFAKVAVRNAEHLLQVKQAQGAAAAAREALYVAPSEQSARDALSQALTAMKVDPADVPERIKFGDGLLAQGRINEASVEYSESLRFKPTAAAHVGLGDIAWRQNRKEQAKRDYEQALVIDPKSGIALRQLGTLRLGDGDIVGANESLSKAVILNPADKASATHLVDLWHGQVTKNPNAANSHLGLARAFQLSGDLSSAQSEYRQVVRLDPANPKLAQARQSFKIALAHQEARHHNETAHQLEAQGRLKDAHQSAVNAVGLYPGNSEFQLYQAHLAQRLGRYGEARKAYEQVLKHDTKNSDAEDGLKSLPPGVDPVVADSVVPTAPALAAAPLGAAAQEMPPLAPSMVPVMAPVQPSPPFAPVQPVLAGQTLPGPAGTQVASAGQVIQPYAISNPQDPDAMAGKQFSTSTHVNTMSNFMTQMVALSQAQKPAAASSAGSSLGALGGALAGGAMTATGAAMPAAGATLSTTTGAPPDTANVLAQAQAALKAAGVKSDPGPAAAMPVSTFASATPVVPSVAPLPPPANSGPDLVGLVQQSFPTVVSGMDPATVQQLVQQYGPLVMSLAATMTPQQLSNMYAQYRPYIQQRLSVVLPPDLPPQIAALAQKGPPPSFPPMRVPPPVAAGMPMASPPAVGTASGFDETVPDVTPVPLKGGSVVTAAKPEGSLPPEFALRGPLGNPTDAHPLVPADTSQPLRGYMSPSGTAAAPAVSAPAAPVPVALVPSAAIANQPIKLELVSMQPRGAEMQLHVRLRNGMTTAFQVPPGMKAIVQMNGKKQTAKVSFTGVSVPANGVLDGVIHVSGHQMNPNSDLWIPNVLPGSGADRNLHMSVTVPSMPL